MQLPKSGLESYFSYILAAAHRNVHRTLTSKLKELGVQVEAWRVMEVIDERAEINMGELAELVLMNPPTLTKMVDRMVADGLVQRQASIEDQRQIHLVLTQLGEKRIAQVREEIEQQDNFLLEKLGAENIENVMNALEEIAHTSMVKQ